MVCLPACFDPAYHDSEASDAQAKASPTPEVEEDVIGWGHGDVIGPRVQDLRALPCEAGGGLCWTGRLLHFGGRAGKHAEVPRMSLACAISADSRTADNQDR